MQRAIYLAAPLFTLAEREFNLRLRACLESRGHQVVLPQEEADNFFSYGQFDFDGLARHCRSQVREYETVVAILDGPDADSGTSVEVGIKAENTRVSGWGQLIGVRTDFRASEDGQLNAMFRLCDEIVYLSSLDATVELLADKIHEVVTRLRGEDLQRRRV